MNSAIWSLTHLFKYGHDSDYELLQVAVPTLCHLFMTINKAEILIDLCGGLSFFLEFSLEEAPLLLPKLLICLKSNNTNLISPAILCIGNILACTNDHTHIVISNGNLLTFKNLLNNFR